jgi:hypothetical protein
MADSELLRIVSGGSGKVAEWRAKVEALGMTYQAQLILLGERRKEEEDRLAISILQSVCDLCEAGATDRFRQLYYIANGCSSEQEKKFDLEIYRTRISPLVPIQPFFDVAKELEGTAAGAFVRDVLTSFQEQSEDIPKDQIRVIGIESGGERGVRSVGLVMLCDNNFGGRPCNNHIDVGFTLFHEPPTRIVVRDAGFLSRDLGLRLQPGSLNERFDQMLLSEKVGVIAALFVATDRAVTEALKERMAAVNG